MRAISYIFCILWISAPVFSQESDDLLEVRTHFHNINGEQEVKSLMNWPVEENRDESPRMNAYRAIATCMMAEYSWSPLKKLGFFRRGTKLMDSVISEELHVESVYLRLLIQLKTPEILNYRKHIESDLAYLKNELPGALIDENYKAAMISNVNALLKEQDRQELALNLNL